MTCPGQPSRIDPKRILWMCTGQGTYTPCKLYEYAGGEIKPAAEWTPTLGWTCPNYQPEQHDDKA
jgi:hypothetical protein